LSTAVDTLRELNCAAIPTGLLESELFGHEKGAFTGAIAPTHWPVRSGRRWHDSFLDEIGEITSRTADQLLRVLQEREFERFGSSRTLRRCRLMPRRTGIGSDGERAEVPIGSLLFA